MQEKKVTQVKTNAEQEADLRLTKKIPPGEKGHFFQVLVGGSWQVTLSPRTTLEITIDTDSCDVWVVSNDENGQVSKSLTVLKLISRGYHRVLNSTGVLRAGLVGASDSLFESLEVGRDTPLGDGKNNDVQPSEDADLKQRCLSIHDSTLPPKAVRIHFFDEVGVGSEIEVVNLSSDSTFVWKRTR